MTNDVLMAGFGGQGMLLAGKILAQAAMDMGLAVSWLPSYGPEMRGGTANVIVRMSSEPIGSPLVSRLGNLVVMNLPSLEKFAPMVTPGGVIILNATLIAKDPGRDDCRVVRVDARALATEVGSDRASNFVMLGAYLGVTGVVSPDLIERAIAAEFAKRKPELIQANQAAFRAGLEEGRRAEVAA